MIPRYSRPQMTDIWSDESRFRLWLEVETLCLEGMVREGIAPASALAAVQKKGAFNAKRILEIEAVVKHDVIAFLTNVAEHVGEEARWLHFGMTSSDLLDTAFALQLCSATDLILTGVNELKTAVQTLAKTHKKTECVGRSHGIHAEPMTFGLKAASWYAELQRQEQRLQQAREDIAVGAISGPVGTYALLTPKVEEFVCERLGLKPAAISTQVIPRDSHARLFLAFAELATSIERIALEIRHLQRTEVREAEEFFSAGQKGSSAMPHKRNPILTENITGLARVIRGLATASLENVALWHERDISHSSAERIIAPDVTIALDFILARATSVVAKLQVYPQNMKRNLESTHGLCHSSSLLVALAAKGLSREEAYKLVQGHAMATWDELNAWDPSGAAAEGRKAIKSFPQRIMEAPEITGILSKEELQRCFSDEQHYAHLDYIFHKVFGGNE